MTFALLFFTGFVAVCIFASRVLETGSASEVIGVAFGLALMVSATLTLPGA